METLLKADVSSSRAANSRLSSLDIAACRGHVSILKAILAHGGREDSTNDDGYTALNYAAIHN